MSSSEVSLPMEETSSDNELDVEVDKEVVDEVDDEVDQGSSSSRQSSPGSSDSFIKKPSSSQWTPSIDDFEIIKPISRGAFGKVFLGRRK